MRSESESLSGTVVADSEVRLTASGGSLGRGSSPHWACGPMRCRGHAARAGRCYTRITTRGPAPVGRLLESGTCCLPSLSLSLQPRWAELACKCAFQSQSLRPCRHPTRVADGQLRAGPRTILACWTRSRRAGQPDARSSSGGPHQGECRLPLWADLIFEGAFQKKGSLSVATGTVTRTTGSQVRSTSNTELGHSVRPRSVGHSGVPAAVRLAGLSERP